MLWKCSEVAKTQQLNTPAIVPPFAEVSSVYAIILTIYMNEITVQWNQIYTKALLYQPVQK